MGELPLKKKDTKKDCQEPWPADVKLYQPYEIEQILLPDNANCLAVQAYLRMCGLSYQIESRANAEFMSPSGTVPFIKCGKYVIPELEPIVSFVENKGISLTTNFDDSQKNDMKAYISLINFVLGNSELYVCWVDEDTYNTVTKPRYSSVYPWPLNHVQTKSKRNAVIKHLKAVKYYNKSIEEVYQEVEQCCRSLSDRLDDKEYFFGSNPTELDALLFGHLYSITNKCKINRLVRIVEKFPSLQILSKNVWIKYFSSFYDFSLVVCDSVIQGETILKEENENNNYPENRAVEKLFNEIGLSGSRSVYGIADVDDKTLRLSMVIDLKKSIKSQEIDNFSVTESDSYSIDSIESKPVELEQFSKSKSFIQHENECTKSHSQINSEKLHSSLSKLNLKMKQFSNEESNFNRIRLMKYLSQYLEMKSPVEFSTENKYNTKEDKKTPSEEVNNSIFGKLFDSRFNNSLKSSDNFNNVQYLFRGNISLKKPPSIKDNIDMFNSKPSLLTISVHSSKTFTSSHMDLKSSMSSVTTVSTIFKNDDVSEDTLNRSTKIISEKFYNKKEMVDQLLKCPRNIGTQTSYYSLLVENFHN